MSENIHQYSRNEEIANTLSHGIGAILSVIALVLLLAYSNKTADPIRVVSYAVYGTSLIILFLASTFYHALLNDQAKRLFKLLDHCAIYLLIAGTYTPIMLLTIKGGLGNIMLILVWLIAIGGILFKIKFGHQYKILSLATYVGMGMLSLTIIHKLYQTLPTNGLLLLTIGGIVYCTGVFFYVQKKIPFNHAIWHLFVLGGATCHFFMIWYHV